MEDIFELRVRTAAKAAWLTTLIGGVVLVLQWILYLVFISSHPAWLLWLWGPDMRGSFVQNVWFWGTAVFKLFLWVLALIALWLTLWGQQLRRRTHGQ
jgi:glucan phosphoethanolaminetransferase (alkaline phosphatase superfamily)